MFISSQPSVKQSSRLIRQIILPHWQTCVYCNKKVCSQMTVDHIVPKAAHIESSDVLQNGINCVENMLISCKKCNNKRGNKLLSKWLSERLEAIEYLLKFLKAIKGIKINGVDYANGVKRTILQTLVAEKAIPEAEGIDIDFLIKKLDVDI